MRCLSIVLAVAGIAGCYTVDSFRQNELQRVSFEMNCPDTDLKLIELGHGRIGVDGCGKRSVYQYTKAGWLLSSATEAPAPATSQNSTPASEIPHGDD